LTGAGAGGTIPAVRLVVCATPAELASTAAALFRDRLAEKPDLAMAVPAGRTPRPMYGLLRTLQRTAPADFSSMRVFAVDELCPPAPDDGYFWRQVRAEFLAWAGVKPDRCHPFTVAAPDLGVMCAQYEALIAAVGGLDLVMLGLGPNGHLASNEPGSPFSSRSRPVRLLPATLDYIRTDVISHGAVCERAVTIGLATILDAREVVVLVSGEGKRAALRRTLHGPPTPDVPASVLQLHPRCTIIADRAAAG
jgi:glucosamine-6-phosphate deaminase